MKHIQTYLDEVKQVVDQLDKESIEQVIQLFLKMRDIEGRLFILGVGGSAGNAAHAVNDFRKIAGFEAYAPTDNVSELTARINDDGWDSSFAAWLAGSRLNAKDLVMVFSVGGGNRELQISNNLVEALKYAKDVGASICGIVGRDGGFTAQVADACVIVPTINTASITPHSEAFQAVIWHLIVSHPDIQIAEMKWESSK